MQLINFMVTMKRRVRRVEVLIEHPPSFSPEVSIWHEDSCPIPSESIEGNHISLSWPEARNSYAQLMYNLRHGSESFTRPRTLPIS